MRKTAFVHSKKDTHTHIPINSIPFKKSYPYLPEEWLKQSNGNEGCYAAVGSIDHSIQLWNLEEADPLEAAQVLGVLDV